MFDDRDAIEGVFVLGIKRPPLVENLMHDDPKAVHVAFDGTVDVSWGITVRLRKTADISGQIAFDGAVDVSWGITVRLRKTTDTSGKIAFYGAVDVSLG